MVGQTLTTKGKPYQYYRCRHVYDKNSGRSCSARYIRCERLEDTVWREVKRALTHPELVFREFQRLAEEKVDEAEVVRLEEALADLREREKRLVHLYTLGQFKEETLRAENATIASQRQVLEEQLWSLNRQVPAFVNDLDQERLTAICGAVARWLQVADEPKKALQIKVLATLEEVRMSGVLPGQVPVTLEVGPASDVFGLEGHPGVPFDRAIDLAA